MSYIRPLTKFTKVDIDAKTSGAVKIGTTENGTERFHPLFAICMVSSASGISLVPSLSVGTNGSSYNDIVTATAMTGLTAVNMMLRSDIVTATATVGPNTDIYVNITVGATATAMKVIIHLFGYYQ